MKTLIKVLLLLAAAGYLIFALVCFTGKGDDEPCTGIAVTVHTDDDGMPSPIDTTYVCELLMRHKFFPEGRRKGDIDLVHIDSTLQADPYVKTSLVYFDADSRLCIDITPHIPIMHIMPEGAAAYYISGEGHVMPADVYDADLPLATGFISTQFAATKLSVMARVMGEDSFWDDQIGQIFVARDSTLTLVPRVGDFSVKMGQPRSLRLKLAHLKAFYTDALPQVGWNVYSEINLEYDNQIIATRKRIKR